MITGTYGKTRCGDILAELLQQETPKSRRRLSHFVNSTFKDLKYIKIGFTDIRSYERVRSIYLLGRFQQLEDLKEWAVEHSINPEILLRMKHIIKVQSKF